jgi:hypothetical protein
MTSLASSDFLSSNALDLPHSEIADLEVRESRPHGCDELLAC